MKKILQLSSILLLVIFGISTSFAQTLDELLKQGDQFVAEFQNQKALDTYLKADKLNPNNWEVYWRISRAYVDLGEKMPDKTDAQKDEQEKVYKRHLSMQTNL